MSEDDLPPLTEQELAELQWQIDNAPPGPAPDGPLPPLESDDPEWVAGRWRKWAAGGRYGEHNQPEKIRSVGTALRQWLPEHALADVFCETSPHSRGRHILRVAVVDGEVHARWNVINRGGPYEASTHNEFALASLTTLAVECRNDRCPVAVHPVSALALQRRLSTREGKPRRVRVTDVLARET